MILIETDSERNLEKKFYLDLKNLYFFYYPSKSILKYQYILSH